MSGFGRSNSLSINTSQTNSLFNSGAAAQPQRGNSLFGSTTNTAQTSGLFGAPAATTQPQTGGLFGASTKAPSTGGLFGNTTSQPQSSGLFGQTTSSAPQSGGLFGNAASTQAPQTQNTATAGSGLFGQSQATGTTGGLFGGNNTAQSQPQASSSLFGGTTLGGGTQTQGQQSGGLFGGLNNQNKPATPSLFGASSTTQAQSKPTLFGSTQPAQATGSSLFGGQNNAQQQNAGASTNTVPGVTIDLSNLRPSTRFSDLHESLKNEIVQMENFIQQQLQYHTQISVFLPSMQEKIASVAPDVEYLSSRLNAVETALDNDANDIHNVKLSVKRDAEEARLSFMAIEQLKLPSQFHYPGNSGFGTSLPRSSLADQDISSAVDMASYFESKQAGLSEAITQHQAHLEEIESHLHTVEASTMQKARELTELRDRGASGMGQTPAKHDGLKDLGMTFQAFEAAILNLATKVGETREGLINVILGNRNGM
ncbi:hypothetical protein EJ05DRAFT_480752 [Pseudovirgaria hyperparasitica]|uniref:Uncharacterized protein n=1 Tax=Pseudovirgaria hyperparasitica TaxID=470096 RepID=A0A6A6VUU5_9PEZI|nr:uncharacterized protein EJ05DRAFT_480752 [Pseudovirgaria hyperparasitica]KAF2753037.1 hypothetical protein EJ05DRAFT_480752 [Pseudovirgaria hyperparasitica]